jgi:adenylylsulfate reductase subunit B
MCCIKACPKGALETRIPYQIGYRPAKLIPMMGTNNITWTCIDIHGKTERFQFETRTTGAGEEEEW